MEVEYIYAESKKESEKSRKKRKTQDAKAEEEEVKNRPYLERGPPKTMANHLHLMLNTYSHMINIFRQVESAKAVLVMFIVCGAINAVQNPRDQRHDEEESS